MDDLDLSLVIYDIYLIKVCIWNIIQKVHVELEHV